MKFYLAGPVGYGIPGVEWKSEIKKYLRGSGHEVYDPIENDSNYPKVPRLNEIKKSPKNNWKEIKDIMQEIFKDDCDYIQNCDYVICYFYGRSLGTAGEQTLAYYLNIYSKKRIKTITIFDQIFKPDEWTICCSDYVFFSINECLKKLRKEF